MSLYGTYIKIHAKNTPAAFEAVHAYEEHQRKEGVLNKNHAEVI